MFYFFNVRVDHLVVVLIDYVWRLFFLFHLISIRLLENTRTYEMAYKWLSVNKQGLDA